MAQPASSATRSSRGTSTAAGVLLVVLCVVQFVDAYDIAAMGPALPKIEQGLHMSPSALQWVVTAYVLGYGGLLLVGGRLADLFNRKNLLIASMLVFIIASLVGGFATDGGVLIGARLVKGISAAFTAPVSLAILLNSYEDPDERNKALGVYFSIVAVGFTSGLVLGGVFAGVSWRLVLFVPAALAIIVTAVAVRVVPGTDHRADGARQRVDLAGAATVTLGLIALVYGMSRASTNGWSDKITISALVAALVLLTAFVQIERVLRTPLVPLGIFRRPGLPEANLAMFLLQGSYVGWQFIATLYLQNVLHWSPIQVGLVFAPAGIVIVLTAQRWAARVMKIGAWPLAAAGIGLETLGYLWSLEFGHLNVVLVFLGAGVIMGFGYAMAYPATNITAVASARTDEQGLASGLFIASFQVGSGVILGIVTSVFISAGHAANAGLGGYRAGILTTIGASALSLLICVAMIIRHRAAAGGQQPAQVREPAEEAEMT